MKSLRAHDVAELRLDIQRLETEFAALERDLDGPPEVAIKARGRLRDLQDELEARRERLEEAVDKAKRSEALGALAELGREREVQADVNAGLVVDVFAGFVLDAFAGG